jgi:glycosyltransferase involved in cell wall biosynthesis
MRLLYFSPVPAGSYAQRPHFLVRAWLERDAESVLWVNPYPCRLPQWQDVRRVRGLNDQGTPVDPRVRVLHVPALPVEPLPLGPWLNRRLFWRSAWREMERFAADGPWVLGVGRPSALALAAIGELQPTASFFDAMDNFPEFHRGLSRRAMRRHEDAIAQRVDLVLASSTFLAEKFARRGLHVEKLLNACENARAESPPSALRLPPSTPVLGYLGCLGRWFDWPLVVRLAEAMPEARVELAGPCAVRPPKRLPANIRLFPACKQSEVAGHLARFTAGLIPFQRSALTAGVDPIKFYEYRAAGLPVLSTTFGEMVSRGRDDGVYFLDRASDLAAVVSAAIGHRSDAGEARRFREENNWAARFDRSACFRWSLPASRMRRAA